MTALRKGPPSAIGDIAMRLANSNLIERENAVLKAELTRVKADKIRLENRNYHLRQKLARLDL